MPSRPHPFRRQKQVILIQCEGSETEYRYFEGVRKACDENAPYRLMVKRGSGQNALAVVTAAKDEGKTTINRTPKYDAVCCVLDVETVERRENLTEAVALARKHGITLYLSNPSFEVWLLCHFGHVTGWLENGDAAARRLTERHWRNTFGCDYDKGDPKLYERLKDYVPAAIDNARWLLETHHNNAECRDANPSTNVYEIVERLLALPPDPAP